MSRNRKKQKLSLPITVAACLALAAAFYLALSYFLETYRRDIYSRIIDSNISALEETTNTLISKTTEGFDHCMQEIRVLGIGISEDLKRDGFASTDEINAWDRSYIQEFNKASVFDYCVLLNESGRGIYSEGSILKPINLYSSQAYVDCLSSPDGEAISFISDPFGAAGKDVVAFSCRTGSVILIGIYSQDSFKALYDSTTFGDNASYMITTDSGLILSGTHVTREVEESLNLFTYIEKNPMNKDFFSPDAHGVSGYERVLSDFNTRGSGSVELYFGKSRYEFVYAPIPQTNWHFISCVSYSHITADAAEINQKTIRLTVFIIVLMLGMFLVILVMMVFVVRANASREAVRRDRIFTLMTRYVPNVIIVADNESGSIEYTSHNTGKVLGIGNAFANLIDERLMECISSQDRKDVLALIGEVRAGRAASGNMTLRFTRPDTNAEVVLSLNAYLIAEEDSTQHFITLTLEDITDSVLSRRRLEEALKNEERANAAKSTFLASMSHDIRTPLNAVIGLTNIALYSPKDSKKVTECLQKISNSSKLLLGLINDVLDMSKIESGKMQLAEAEFELGEWLDGLVTVTQSQTSVRGQHFDINVWNITHEILCGDTVRLGQVLTNVLGNAVKFTPKGGEILLDVTEVPSKDPLSARYVFRVSDTGIGMSQEYKGHIFEMFSRDRNSSGKGIQGTGLGMAITKRIVDMMDGTIDVESEEGKGTVFTIELSVRISGRQVPLAAGCRMLVIGNPGSEDRCMDAVWKLKEIGVEASYETDYAAAAALAVRKRQAGTPFSMIFIPYKLLKYDPSITGDRLKRDFGEDTRLLLGLKPDEQEVAERHKREDFLQTISLPLFRMSLYRKITAMFGSSEETADGLAGRLKGLHVLLVEDNAINLEIAMEVLTGMMEAVVDTARNGEEGCQRFLAAPADTYDVILMDLQMPVLGGLDASRKIRGSSHPQASSVPIIALTANAFEEDHRDALEAGMNGFVSKPIDFTVLAKEIIRVRREGRSLRLLLAEDNEINREIAVSLIEADGQSVDAVEDGKQALEVFLAAPDHTYDAVLLDLHMPVMDGFEAAAAIRGSGKPGAGAVPIIALTASSEDEVRSEAARAGFGAVMAKPIDMEQLRGLLA